MNAFWREKPLSAVEQRLLYQAFDAHNVCAYRNNISSCVLMECARGSHDLNKAICAALSSVGGIHAPLVDTYFVLMNPDSVDGILKNGLKVPGWGSSFPDDKSWNEVESTLKEHFPEVYSKIEIVTSKLKAEGKDLKPNPSAFTAAVGIVLEMPCILLPWLFIQGRLNAWCDLFIIAIKKETK